MSSPRSSHPGAAVLGVAFLTVAVGLVAAAGQEQKAAVPRQPAGKADDAPASPDDQVVALVRAYDDARSIEMARPLEDLLKDRAKFRAAAKEATRRRKDFAGRFLALAERYPRTNAAGQALTWIVAKDSRVIQPAPELERALEILARDHVGSDRIKAVLGDLSPFAQWSSPSIEAFFRHVLERSPYYETRGLACYRLAELLIERAERLRIWQLLGSPAQVDGNWWLQGGPEAIAVLRRGDPARVEDEAARLLERVIAQFPRVAENHLGRNPLGTALAEPARTELDRLRHLSIGKPAPEIDGVDLDGRPMKLSDYRGKVVVLYFSPYYSRFPNRLDPQVVTGFRRLNEATAGKPFAMVGVVTWQIEQYRKELRASGLQVPFWADPATREHFAGPIHAAWHENRESIVPYYYVLDARGTIRYRLPHDFALIEKAMSALLAERPD